MFKLEKVYCNVYINNDLMKIAILTYSNNDTDILYSNSIDHEKSIIDGFISNNEVFNEKLFYLLSEAYKYIPLIVRRIILVLPSNIFIESINQNDKILYTSGSVTLQDIHNSIKLSTNPDIKNYHCVSSAAYQYELDGQMYVDPPINKAGNQLRALIVSYYLANNLFSKLEQSFKNFDIDLLEVIPEAICASYNVASTELLNEGITHLIVENNITTIVPTIKGMQYKPYNMQIGTNNILSILSEKLNLDSNSIINYSKLLDFDKDNQKETIVRKFEDYYESIKNITLEDLKTKIKSNLDIFFEKIIDKMNELRLYSNTRKKVYIWSDILSMTNVENYLNKSSINDRYEFRIFKDNSFINNDIKMSNLISASYWYESTNSLGQNNLYSVDKYVSDNLEESFIKQNYMMNISKLSDLLAKKIWK